MLFTKIDIDGSIRPVLGWIWIAFVRLELRDSRPPRLRNFVAQFATFLLPNNQPLVGAVVRSRNATGDDSFSDLTV